MPKRATNRMRVFPLKTLPGPNPVKDIPLLNEIKESKVGLRFKQRRGLEAWL